MWFSSWKGVLWTGLWVDVNDFWGAGVLRTRFSLSGL